MHVWVPLSVQIYAVCQTKYKVVEGVRRDLLLLRFHMIQHRQRQHQRFREQLWILKSGALIRVHHDDPVLHHVLIRLGGHDEHAHY